jgi:hypothetical protein
MPASASFKREKFLVMLYGFGENPATIWSKEEFEKFITGTY